MFAFHRLLWLFLPYIHVFLHFWFHCIYLYCYDATVSVTLVTCYSKAGLHQIQYLISIANQQSFNCVFLSTKKSIVPVKFKPKIQQTDKVQAQQAPLHVGLPFFWVKSKLNWYILIQDWDGILKATTSGKPRTSAGRTGRISSSLRPWASSRVKPQGFRRVSSSAQVLNSLFLWASSGWARHESPSTNKMRKSFCLFAIM